MINPSAELPPHLADMQYREHEVYDRWVVGHQTELFSHRPFDPENHDQLITTSHLEAIPSLEAAHRMGEVAMGKRTYEHLLDELEQVVEVVEAGAADNYSTWIASLHLDNPYDVVVSHNSLFVASNDKEFSNKNVVLINPLMTRLKIAELAITKAISNSGRQVFGIPADGAEKHSMPSDIMQYRNRSAGMELKKLFKQGAPIALHWAPSGTRTNYMELKAKLIKVVPEVTEENAHMLVKRTRMAVGVPMSVKIGNGKVKVLEPRKLEKTADVHQLMSDMAEAASELGSEEVFYGKPSGARSLDESEIVDLSQDNGRPVASMLKTFRTELAN